MSSLHLRSNLELELSVYVFASSSLFALKKTVLTSILRSINQRILEIEMIYRKVRWSLEARNSNLQLRI